MRSPAARRAVGAALLVVACGAGVTLASGVPEPPASKGPFRVDGNRILAPGGEEFIVKGVVSPYGTFAGGDAEGLGRRNERNARRDFKRIRSLGANTVKVYVTPQHTNRQRGRRRLRRVVNAARAERLLVMIASVYGSHEATVPWLRYLARTYKDDPWVWLVPSNEPNCTAPATTPERCGDWELWQRQHREYLRVIRGAGMEAPVLVNTPGYSWDVSGIEGHQLGDDQVVLGAHRYANDAPRLTREAGDEIERAWAGLAEDRAVVLDELGNWNGPEFANSPAWTRDMVAYARRWVRQREGSGVIAFNWRWSDPNALTRPGGRLTQWGRTYVNGYLRRVDGHR